MTLLEQLKAIRSAGTDNTPFAGICRCLDVDERADFRYLCTQWPKFSGDITFPVPSPWPEQYSAAYQYLHGPSKFMWDPDHPYGALRLELLDWCINFLEK